MPLPVTFGGLSGQIPLSDLDENFNTLGIFVVLTCSVTGTNTLQLTLVPDAPTITGYFNYMIFSFVANATNTGAVTAQVGAFGALPVYKDSGSGPTALTGSEIVYGNFVLLAYDTGLNYGNGGFHLKDGVSVTTPTISGTPTSGQIAQWVSDDELGGVGVTGGGSVVLGYLPDTDNTSDGWLRHVCFASSECWFGGGKSACDGCFHRDPGIWRGGDKRWNGDGSGVLQRNGLGIWLKGWIMSVADIFNIPSTAEELAEWSTLHMILHRSENRAVFDKFGVILPEYVLDPMDPTPYGSWFQQHQTMHNNVDQIAGVAQFDLIDVDWTNAAQRAGWFQGHAQLHRQETDALEVFS